MPHDSLTNTMWFANTKHHLQTNAFSFAKKKRIYQINTYHFSDVKYSTVLPDEGKLSK